MAFQHKVTSIARALESHAQRTSLASEGWTACPASSTRTPLRFNTREIAFDLSLPPIWPSRSGYADLLTTFHAHLAFALVATVVLHIVSDCEITSCEAAPARWTRSHTAARARDLVAPERTSPGTNDTSTGPKQALAG